MRVAWISDSHPEMYRVPARVIAADIIAFIGDNGTTPAGVRNIILAWREKNPSLTFIVVLGNHEAHGRVWQEFVQEYRTALADLRDVHFLEDESREIGGYTFIGSTLWTDLNPIAAIAVQKILEDYRPTGIRSRTAAGELVAVTPEEVGIRHRKSLRFIENTLQWARIPSKVIVLTHHAPSHQSWTTQNGPLSDRLQEAYCSDLEGLIEKYAPLVWAHGHVHSSQNYMIDKTLIVCNPQGYTHLRDGIEEYENSDFDPQGAVIDLDVLRARRGASRTSKLRV